MGRRKYLILSGLCAVAFLTYSLLDTFVIAHSYQKVETGGTGTSVNTGDGTVSASDGSSAAGASMATGTVTVTEDSYSDDNITITISNYRENDTDIYVADIQLSSPEYLKTALAKATYGKNVTDTTSDIAEENNAILAINGDYYGVQESGYVIRNGVLYRDTAKEDQEDLAIYEDGSFEIISEAEVSAKTLLENGAVNVLSFGPGLIEDGEISVTSTDEVDKAMTSNPRTAIGVIDDCHYVFVVADGRTSESTGLSLYQLAEFMEGLGVTEAYNLDGGGSSTMVFNGTVVNNPTSTGTGGKSHSHGSGKSSSSDTDSESEKESSERSVSDIVYIGY